MIGEATLLTPYSELQLKTQISTGSKAEERQDKSEFKRKALLYQLIITGPNVTNDFELGSSEICLLPVERREWRKLTVTNFNRLNRKLVRDGSTMAHKVLFFWVKPWKQCSIIEDLILYLFCSLGLNIAHYKCHLMDFWYHRSQHHSGRRPRRCKCFYEYWFACAVFWTMKWFVFTGRVTWRLRSSSFSAKANIWTSKRLKWEGCWTLASVHTGWKTTWCGSVCGQLDNLKEEKFSLHPILASVWRKSLC